MSKQEILNTEITAEYNQLVQTVAELEEAITVLESRLNMVLDMNKKELDDNIVTCERCSPLGRILQGLNHRIITIHTNLNNITQRITL